MTYLPIEERYCRAVARRTFGLPSILIQVSKNPSTVSRLGDGAGGRRRGDDRPLCAVPGVGPVKVDVLPSAVRHGKMGAKIFEARPWIVS